ncbi:MIP/aquaporin family protein [Streptomyces chartreusis]|uniref:MIP/aquaporin family protein n=1 Tax=Streptomyces chartreusis TaxID=1969 RepID=UPI002E82294E|nr:aquaporin [Streptomyces chartreusis]WUB23847.1 aquaporin [Streptomyces chartreusis]
MITYPGPLTRGHFRRTALSRTRPRPSPDDKGHPRRGIVTSANAGSPAPHPLLRRALAEFAGSVLLVFLGISAMIAVNWLAGPPLTTWPGGEYLLSLLLGLAFGYTVTSVIYLPLGRISGQYNPAFSLVPWAMGRQSARTTLLYLIAQLAGGVLGAVLLLVWGRRGAEFRYGATVPIPEASLWAPVVAELVSTMAVALAIIATIRGKATGRWAFHLVPMLYGVLAPVAAPLSGLSTNPARTLGWRSSLASTPTCGSTS